MICPFCKEEIKEGALKCKYCGSELPQKDRLDLEQTLTGLSLQAQERYEIKEELDRGGMGVVYKAYDRNLKRFVALKVLSDELNRNPTAVARFGQEAILAAGLNHPNIITIFDIEKKSTRKYISMSYIEGKTLQKQLEERNTPFTLDETTPIITQICSALSFAHSQGVIHRDIKPSNILIDKTGRVVVSDFGIAKAAEGTTKFTLTGTGSTLGTPHYMSPEQAEGKELTNRSDIYSLGILIYEILTKRVPFEADTPIALGIKHIRETPPPPRSFNSDIPEEVERIILKTLSKDPQQRYADARELAEEMNLYLDVEKRKQRKEEIRRVEEQTRLLPELKSKIHSLFHSEEFESAQREIENALEIFPAEVELQQLLNTIPYKIINRDIRINLEKAKESFDKYDFESALHFANEVLKLDEAHQEAQSIVKESQNELLIIEEALERGKGLFSNYKFSEAIEEFSKILQINPGQPEAKSNIGKINETIAKIEELNNSAKGYLKEKKYTLAYKNWQRALKLNPTDEEIKKSFEEIRPIVVRRKKRQKYVIISTVSLFFIFLFGQRYFFPTFKFVNNGMAPTIAAGDKVKGSRLAYFSTKPERWDIIIFKPPFVDREKNFVGRIAGLPGETLEIEEGNIFINGQKMENPQIYYYNYGKYGKDTINIPNNSYFILNDNSATGNDSRYWGVLPREYIVCKVIKIKHLEESREKENTSEVRDIKKKSFYIKWKYKTEGAPGGPTICGNTLFVSSYGGYLYALNREEGSLQWKYKADSVLYEPTVFGDTVYVGSYGKDYNHGGYLYALDKKDGVLKWKYEAKGHVWRCAVSGDKVYVVSYDNYLYALDSRNANLKWKYKTEDNVTQAVSDGDKLYVSSLDNYLYALDTEEGMLRWKYKTGYKIVSKPAISNETVYVGSEDHYIYALNKQNGDLIWKYETDGIVSEDVSISEDTIYASSQDHYLYALDKLSGRLNWKYKFADHISNPTISDEFVYVGSHNGLLYALDKSGKLKFDYAIGGIIEAPIVFGDTIYVCSNNGFLYAISKFALTVTSETISRQ